MTIEEALAVERRLRAGDLALDDQDQIATALAELCGYWLDEFQGTAMKGQLGAPDWTGFEMKIWELGETLRHFLKRKRGWRGRCRVLDAVRVILLDPRFGKGRQTFALLLGDFGQDAYGQDLGDSLQRPEVRGHALKALKKRKISGFESEARAIAEEEKGWIRSAARSYLRAVASDA